MVTVKTWFMAHLHAVAVGPEARQCRGICIFTGQYTWDLEGDALKATTSERIIAAASRLFYSEGIRSVSVDAVAAKAGVTKRTLYYHFKSKDDLVAAYLSGRDQPNIALFQRWFAETDGDVADKTRGIFIHLAQSARHPKWRGCGFLRTSAELANLPGHPAIKIGAAHKKKFERWMQDCFEAAGIGDALRLARQIALLLDGSFAVSLLHRDPSYMEAAGDAAHALVKMAAPRRRATVAQGRACLMGNRRRNPGHP
jgi:AcrR family transcriptional regulator